MKNKVITRLYNFPDANLIVKGKTNVAFIKRDLPQFAQFAVTPESVEAYATSIDVFAQNINDTLALGDQKMATEAKDAKAEELRVVVRDVMTHVGIKFTEGSTEYLKFGTSKLSKLTDPALLFAARTAVIAGNKFLTDLAGTGLTVIKLKNLTKLADELEALMVVANFSVADRDSLQRARVLEGNAIYANLVKLSGIGCNIWEAVDESKYNDYIIYNTKSGENEEGGQDYDPI